MPEKTMKLQIITPERIFFDGEAEMVELNTSEGKIGIYPGHIPMTMILQPGILSIHQNGGTRIAALHTGFVEILPERVSVVAEVCEWPEEIDTNRAEEAKIRAARRLENQTGVNIDRAQIALRKALARLEAAGKKS